MQQVLLIIHLLIAVALVGVVLLQRSEGGGLGIGGGGGGMGGGGNLMSVRGTANLLTRVTALLAASFMISSMVLAIMGSRQSDGTSVFDTLPLTIEESAPGEGGAADLLGDDLSTPATNVPLD